MEVFEFLIYMFYGYLIVGFFFALWFTFKGVKKVDDGMIEVKTSLRLLLIPGSMALWPFMMKKYAKKNK